MSNQNSSLYERLGGVYAIANVVDDLIERSMRNPMTMSNTAVSHGYQVITPPAIKYLVTELVCQLAGGPQTYSGKAMPESHAHLEIGKADWKAFVGDLQQSLTLFNVPQPEQEELLAVVNSYKKEIVTK